MLFSSFQFIVFFPITCIVYFLIPNNKLRNIWLLAASYYFYMCWNVKYSLLLLGVTVFSYIWAILLQHRDYFKETQKKGAKLFLAVGVAVPISVLVLFKYAEFLLGSISKIVAGVTGTSFSITLNLLLPVGISFYIFQNISYLIDVYRKDVGVEKSFIDYALYISFFPQLVAGPIELSKEFLAQFKYKHEFDYDRMKKGLMLMLWGYFLKLVIADRAGIYVDAVAGNIENYSGGFQLLAAMLFPIQIYTDFYGYSTIALGVGEVMGFKMTDNFKAPFLSDSFAALWRRWHISLYNWFRNYVYFPLGGNRKGTVRKYINLMIVCLLSGMWHGANWTYAAWGILVGLFQIIEAFTIGKKESRNAVEKCLRIALTYILFAFSVIFFRATSVKNALLVIASICTVATGEARGELFEAGLSAKSFVVLIIAIIILFVADLLKSKKLSIRDYVLSKNLAFQWAFILIALVVVVVFGIYGDQYSPFIYFVF